MTSGAVRGLLAVLLVGGGGCATPPPPPGRVVKAETLTLGAAPATSAPIVPAAAAQAAPAAPAPAAAFEPVTENRTFVVRGGVPQYKIGLGDILEILLTSGFAQERQTVPVKVNGTVAVAFTDARVAGLTAEQAGEEIRRLLAPFYRQITVEVLVKEPNSKKVAVLGAVGKTGTLPLKGRTTLVDLLVEVGGPAANADLERVRVTREEGPPVTVNLFRLLEEPRAHAFVLDAGDLVFVPTRSPAEAKAEERAEEKRVFVLGEVKTPGAHPLAPNMRLSQALALAGGPTDVAILESARIIRGGLATPLIIEADFRKVLEEGDASQDPLLLPGDLIVLPRSAIGNWNAFIAKIKPTLEVLTFPLALPVQINAISK